MRLTTSDTRGIQMHLLLFTNTTQRKPWFQYVRREYATGINLPCLITLKESKFEISKVLHHEVEKNIGK